MQTDPDLSDEIRRFEEQYAENPDSLVFARLADLHRKTGRPERALEILEEGLERHPDYLSAHIVRARCLRDLGRLDEAGAVFRRVLELDSENLVALRSLAEMAWERGDGETAREHVEELLQLDPRNEEARELMQEIRGGGASPAGPDTSGAWEEEEEEPFVAEDDPFATPSWAEPRRSEPEEEEPEALEEPEPIEEPDEGSIIEPSSRREAAETEEEPETFEEPAPPEEPEAFEEPGPAEEPEAFEEPAPFEEPGPAEEPESFEERAPFEERDELEEPGEAPAREQPEASEPLDAAGPYDPEDEEPRTDRDEPAAERAFDVEPVEGEKERTEPAEPAEPTERTGPPAPSGAGPTPEPGDEEEGDRWWDFLRSGPEGGEVSEEPEPEAPTPEAAAPGTADAGEPAGGPAVGPASESEELEEQIEELRLQAEQETDLSDADEDLATETLANLYEAQGFYREAVEMYEELVAQRPDDEDLRRRLERAREALEDAGDAVDSPPGTEPAAGRAAEGGEESAAPAEPAGRSAPHREMVTAASQLRAVLRGDASPEDRDPHGP